MYRCLYTLKLVAICFAATFAAKASVATDDPIKVGQTDSAEFDTLYENILTEAGIRFEMLVLPTARKRRMFVDGKILIDCCAAVAWRTRPEEIAVQLHSKTFIHSAEHYFYHRNSAINVASHEDLQNYRLAVVRGYVYKGQENFTDTVMVKDIEEMMKVVAINRAQMGLINPYDFKKRMAANPLPLRLGGVHESSPLTIRVHKSKAEYLERINAVIDRFLADGTIDKALRLQKGLP